MDMFVIIIVLFAIVAARLLLDATSPASFGGTGGSRSMLGPVQQDCADAEEDQAMHESSPPEDHFPFAPGGSEYLIGNGSWNFDGGDRD